MSNLGLPTELIDKIFDFLRDDTDTLKCCCLVSKSWIPPSRKRLFAEVEFFSPKIRQAWKNTFPDPSTSPACYTKSLQVHVNSKGIPLADAYREKRDRPFTFRDLPLLARRFYFRFLKGRKSGWIPTFSQVEHFLLVIEDETKISFVPFHGFSLVLKSLHIHQVCALHSHISGLICSFPLLEDLSVAACCGVECRDDFNEQLAGTLPSSSPPFTGSLELSVGTYSMYLIATGLLSLPSGLHFQELNLKLGCDEDISSATALVEECSSTLGSLRLSFDVDRSPAPVDLSKATELGSVAFKCGADNPQYITATLRTITRNHRNFQHLSIHLRRTIGEAAYSEWLELDRLLAQLHGLHSIRLAVRIRGDEREARTSVGLALPEVMTRGIVDLEILDRRL